jgi:predicted esterase
MEAGIPSNRIVLGGFSQGGAMSLFSGITSDKRLGGIFGLSCYLLLHSKLNELTKNGANKETPIFMGHGDSDPLVRPEWGVKTAQELKAAGYKVDLNMYRYVSPSNFFFLSILRG